MQLLRPRRLKFELERAFRVNHFNTFCFWFNEYSNTGLRMDLSMEVAIKAVTYGWSPEDFDNSGIETEFEDLKTSAPHLLTSNTYMKLMEAEVIATTARERCEQAALLKDVWKDIRHSCHRKNDPLLLIDKSYHQQVKRLQASILLSQDPVGCLLGTEDPELELLFIDELHHAVLRHVQHREARLLHSTDDAMEDAGSGNAIQSVRADVDGIKMSIFNLRLQHAECFLKFDKVFQEFITRSLSLPELNEKQHSLFYKLQRTMNMHNDVMELLIVELNDLYGETHKTGIGMRMLQPRIHNLLLHKFLETQRKLELREALCAQFEKIWSPKVESMINLYRSKCQQLKMLERGLKYLE